jgi:hypothetical protein
MVFFVMLFCNDDVMMEKYTFGNARDNYKASNPDAHVVYDFDLFSTLNDSNDF